MLHGVGTAGRVFFGAMLAVFAALALFALAAGWWIYAVVAAVLAGVFAWTAPFVLGRRWRPAAPAATRKPVVKRRR